MAEERLSSEHATEGLRKAACLPEQVAKQEGILWAETLTGFKWLGELV